MAHAARAIAGAEFLVHGKCKVSGHLQVNVRSIEQRVYAERDARVAASSAWAASALGRPPAAPSAAAVVAQVTVYGTARSPEDLLRDTRRDQLVRQADADGRGAAAAEVHEAALPAAA